MPLPVDERAMRELRRRFGQTLVTPHDAEYDAACAVWNGRCQRRPGALVRCRSAADVAAAVDLARERDLLVAVRSGGHDYAGHSTCDGGLVIDLSAMKRVEVDPERRVARVEPGATWGELDAATAAHGLTTTGGTVSTVGVAGFVLGGGTGWLARHHGLAIDNLLAAEVVLASGERVRTSADELPDLHWALRGGGGNFGVVTSFELRLHPLPERVVAGQLVYRHDAAGGMLRRYREFMASAPDEVGCYAFFYRAPPIDAFPAALHGEVVAALVVAWTGEPERAAAALAPLRAAGEPELDTVTAIPYLELQRSFDAGMPKGLRWCSRAVYLDSLSDAAIAVLVEGATSLPGEATIVYLDPMGGAMGRVAPAATAFPHRSAAFGLHVFPGWSDPADDATNVAWATAFLSDVAPHAADGVYVNMLGDDEPERVPAAYGGNYARLRELRRRFDPGNLFRCNHNIPPVG
jgi:FAD/FMN-containing dehydrogenase